jgi:hypothetical protein
MNERWTFTEPWESWVAGESIYPNGVLSRAQFVILRDAGVLVRASEYKPKIKAAKATKATVTRESVRVDEQKESVDK